MGFVYILLCEDNSYYTGSTIDINKRYIQHVSGQGANHTRKHPPVCIVYLEEYPSIKEAFEREKQIQGWSRKKKEALIYQQQHTLPQLSMAYRDLNNH